MEELPSIQNPQLLIGIDTHDDAGVVLLQDDLALIQTVDFFTPIVDDPYDFGQIAVANALSDIYAMGVRPLTALNIVGFPVATMDKKILASILHGGWDKAQEAGVMIIGGHSVKDPEIKYGLAVTAVSPPDKVIRNNTPAVGDRLILTKPLGTGILTTALKNEKLPEDLLRHVTMVMKKLNGAASEIMLKYQVTACTDITGFGFLGHLLEMVRNQLKTVAIDARSIPFHPETFSFLSAGHISGGLKENRKFLTPFVEFLPEIDDRLFMALCDPQTSGGLLFSLPPEQAKPCLKHLHEEGVTEAAIVGEIIEAHSKPIIVKI